MLEAYHLFAESFCLKATFVDPSFASAATVLGDNASVYIATSAMPSSLLAVSLHCTKWSRTCQRLPCRRSGTTPIRWVMRAYSIISFWASLLGGEPSQGYFVFGEESLTEIWDGSARFCGRKTKVCGRTNHVLWPHTLSTSNIPFENKKQVLRSHKPYSVGADIKNLQHDL